MRATIQPKSGCTTFRVLGFHPLLLGQQLDGHDVAIERAVHGDAPGDEDVLPHRLAAHVPLARVEAVHPQRPLRAGTPCSQVMVPQARSQCLHSCELLGFAADALIIPWAQACLGNMPKQHRRVALPHRSLGPRHSATA